jgi:hypothetical protein
MDQWGFARPATGKRFPIRQADLFYPNVVLVATFGPVGATYAQQQLSTNASRPFSQDGFGPGKWHNKPNGKSPT